MKVILYNAISIDGFIATAEGNSEWVSDKDAEIFEKLCRDIGCIFVGRKTFDQYYKEVYPMEGIVNIVVTSNASKVTPEENIVFVHSVSEAIQSAKDKGFENVMLVGGGTINSSFLKENAINEVILSIHPLILGNGIKIFQNAEVQKELELVDVQKIDNFLVQVRYEIK